MVPGARGWGRGLAGCKGPRECGNRNGDKWCLGVVVASWVNTSVKTYWTVHLKWVNFVIWKLYLNTAINIKIYIHEIMLLEKKRFSRGSQRWVKWGKQRGNERESESGVNKKGKTKTQEMQREIWKHRGKTTSNRHARRKIEGKKGKDWICQVLGRMWNNRQDLLDIAGWNTN